MLLKFGSNHTVRGPSLTNTYERGNFVSEFAHSQSTTAFNILLVVARGTQNMFRPFGSTPADLQKNWNATTSASDNGELNIAVAIAAAGGHAALLDLRPVLADMSNGRLKVTDGTFARLLRSYDAVVVVPVAHASTLIVNP